jgi:serine/threonine protein kinase
MSDRVGSCPSVARTHAVHSDDHSIYLVQDLLVGGSLQAMLDTEGRLEEDEAAAAARGALEALAACHDAGICYGGAFFCSLWGALASVCLLDTQNHTP